MASIDNPSVQLTLKLKKISPTSKVIPFQLRLRVGTNGIVSVSRPLAHELWTLLQSVPKPNLQSVPKPKPQKLTHEAPPRPRILLDKEEFRRQLSLTFTQYAMHRRWEVLRDSVGIEMKKACRAKDAVEEFIAAFNDLGVETMNEVLHDFSKHELPQDFWDTLHHVEETLQEFVKRERAAKGPQTSRALEQLLIDLDLFYFGATGREPSYSGNETGSPGWFVKFAEAVIEAVETSKVVKSRVRTAVRKYVRARIAAREQVKNRRRNRS